MPEYFITFGTRAVLLEAGTEATARKRFIEQEYPKSPIDGSRVMPPAPDELGVRVATDEDRAKFKGEKLRHEKVGPQKRSKASKPSRL